MPLFMCCASVSTAVQYCTRGGAHVSGYNAWCYSAVKPDSARSGSANHKRHYLETRALLPSTSAIVSLVKKGTTPHLGGNRFLAGRRVLVEFQTNFAQLPRTIIELACPSGHN
eukprot:jgi/Chrzof1/11097/Cz05g23160.t1